MKPKRSICWLLAALMLVTGCISTTPPAPATPAAPLPPTTAANGTTVNVSTPTQPCCPHETLWQFLGVTGGAKLIGGIIERIRNRLGSVFPGLESKPPILAITDPKMAASSNPAEAAAAGAKADEDAAPQKIKAIRYLATLGCAGCYPGIEDALLESLDDCTEEVRWEAAKALRELSGKPCSTCKIKSCCSPKVLKKLDEVANKMEKGCYKESSARVRREARLALGGCGGTPPASSGTPQEGPTEGPPAAEPKPVTASETSSGGANFQMADNGPAATKAQAVSSNSSRRRAKPGQSNVPLIPADDDCGCGQTQSVVVQTTPAAKIARSSGTPTRAPSAVSSNSATAPDAAPHFAKPSNVSVIRSSGAVLAEVNGELVFESEVAPEVDRQLANLGSTVSVDEKLRQRPAYIRRELAKVVDRKLLCQEARRSSPNVAQTAFDTPDGDESAIATAWLKENLRVDETVSEVQLAACYRANMPMFRRPAEVRYEQLMAPMEKFSSRDEARSAIEYVRNRALGIPQPPFGASRMKAVEAKTVDWTRKDQVPSPTLAKTLFTLPIGAISEVIEDEDGWRVLRVLERQVAGPAPLELVVEEVRRQIIKERREYLQESYLRQLRSRARIWTAFDPASSKAQAQGIRPLAD
jgi:hypothetical protein